MLWIFSIVLIFLSSADHAVTAELSAEFSTFQRPPLDFGSIGNSLQFGGNFDSISLYDYPTQRYILNSDPSTFNTSYSTLYLENSSNNQIYPIGDINGKVRLISPFKDSYIISGSFNSIILLDDDSSSQSSKDIGSLTLFNTSSNSFTNLDPNNELVGTVNVVYGDDTNNMIYIGGDFSLNATYSLAVFDASKNSLSVAPFKGFNKGSVVNSISRVADDTIVFGGNFYQLGVPQLQYTNQTYFLEFEDSIMSNTSTASKSSIEQFLIQTEQMVSFRYASISADNTKSGQFSDLICPSSSNTWLTNDGQLGAWNARLPFSVSPSKIRIYNSREDNTGVKYFRLYTSPSNSIMNLTYIDPSTNKLATCDAWCPLLAFSDLNSKYASINDSSVTNVSFSNAGGVAASIQWSADYQDFGFINNLEVSYIDLQIVGFYGTNAGLNAVQMFTTEILTFANSTLNDNSCGGTNSNNSYSDITGNNWELSSTGQYMVNSVSDLTTASSDAWGVTFYPNISYSGDYSIDYMTPGCQQDGTCSSRGTVDVIFWDGQGNALNKFTSAQTNEFNKIENVFNGHINITDGSKPSVQIRVNNNGASGTEIFVADKIGVTILSIDDLANSTNSTMGKIISNSSVTFNSSEYKIPLNGLFEYSLKNFTNFPASPDYNFSTSAFNNKFVGNSSINQFGASQLSNTSMIESLQFLNNTLYCGGELQSFSGSKLNNLVGLSLSSADKNNNLGVSGLLDLSNGLNGKVNNLLIISDQLYIIGDFNGTSQNAKVSNLGTSSNNNALTHVAVLGDGANWYSLDSGTTNDLEYSSVASINGTQYLVFADSNLENMTLWDTKSNQWISNSDFNNTGIFINITASGYSSFTSMMTGHMSLLGLITKSSKMAYVNSENEFSQSSLVFEDPDNSVINQFLFINTTLSVMAGKFTTTQSNISNLLINNNGAYSTIENIDYNNTAIDKVAVDSNNRYMFIGFNGVFTYSGSQRSNVLIYDLQYKNVTVPGMLSKNNGNETANINSFYYDEKNNQLLVGGDFDLASSMTCQTVCFFDLNSNRWEYNSQNSFSDGSIVNYMNITDNELFLTGVFNLNSTSSYFATYDFSKTTFSLETDIYDSKSQVTKRENDSSNTTIPGPVDQYILIDGSLGTDYRMLFMGSNYISVYNTSTWTRLDILNNELSASSTFKKLEFISLTTKNSTKKSISSNDYYFASSQAALLVIGDLIFNSYGNIHVSAAIFNGTNWLPYIYTTSDDTGRTAQINDFMINKAISMDSLNSDFFKSLKMDRGWIVFIGLALALGTMMILSLGAMLILFWRRMRGDNGGIHQRIMEGDMLETVPPSKLFNEMDEFKFTD